MCDWSMGNRKASPGSGMEDERTVTLTVERSLSQMGGARSGTVIACEGLPICGHVGFVCDWLLRQIGMLLVLSIGLYSNCM